MEPTVIISFEFLTEQARRWAERKPRTHEEIMAYMESLWNVLDAAGYANSIQKSSNIEKLLYSMKG